MAWSKLEEKIAEEVLRIIADTEIELVDVEYVKEREWYLRIFLDKPDRIGLEDCQTVSQALSQWLEDEDPITQAYHLEVSSPGLDRPLKRDIDLERNIGSALEVHLFAPYEGKKKWVGALERFDSHVICLNIEQVTVELAREKISKVRLYLG